MTANDLAQLRTRLDRCELVMLADVSLSTILAADCAIKLGQEDLDEICKTAALIFDGVASDLGDVAYVSKPTGTRIFVRGSCGNNDVLCLVIAPRSEFAGVVKAARDLMAAVPYSAGRA